MKLEAARAHVAHGAGVGQLTPWPAGRPTRCLSARYREFVTYFYLATGNRPPLPVL